MCIQETGAMATKMEKELIYFLLQEWSLLVNGKMVKLLLDSGDTQMVLFMKVNSNKTNQEEKESGISKTEM